MKIFDLEQELFDCWRVTDDVKMVTSYFCDGPKFENMDPELYDELTNKFFAIQELYDLKFEKLWNTFESVSHDFHHYRKIAEQEDIFE